MREETTRQLDQTVVKDWNYQVEFNKRKKDEERLQKEAYACQEKQVDLKSYASLFLEKFVHVVTLVDWLYIGKLF